MNTYEVKLTVFIEAEDKIDALEQVKNLDISDLDIDSIEEC
jgi:hypothetical protein